MAKSKTMDFLAWTNNKVERLLRAASKEYKASNAGNSLSMLN